MTKGRSTSVIGLRLLNVIVERLKQLARQRGQSLSEMLRPVVVEFGLHGSVKPDRNKYPTSGVKTSVICLRLPDEVVNRLNGLARKHRLSKTKLLMPVITRLAIHGEVRKPSNEAVSSLPVGCAQISQSDPRFPVSRGSPTPAIDFSKVGRNDPCPCGSGKKFKKCHGA
jgi:predicted DNA-binding protein